MAEEKPTERYGDRVLALGSDTERERLEAIADVCDGTTIEVLTKVGIEAGWQCLEVGAGGGSVATWMAGRVHDGTGRGHVIATDIDVRDLVSLASPSLEIRQHDVTTDNFGSNIFDLIHARFVLEHLPLREQVLDRFMEWLSPGGVVVIESIASFPIASCKNDLFRAAMISIEDVLTKAIGTDTKWARRFPEPLLHHGFKKVDAHIRIHLIGGRNSSAKCWSLTLAQLRERIIETQSGSDELIEETIRLLDDPHFFDFGYATVVAYGHKPA